VTLAAYRDLMLRWNQRVNLTAARTAEEIDEHVADCLHLLPHLPEQGRLIDVGAGGGLPAVVIAISRPALEVTALEPTHKKHAFLRTAARELGLANLDARAERWEDHAGRDYDAATSRATLAIERWLEIGVGLVRAGGVVLGMEGRDKLEPLPPGVTRHAYGSRAILKRIVELAPG
jgi:16S rRNA (guanine527-N7)-methyltransferase